MKTLIVDDLKVARIMLMRDLKQIGYHDFAECSSVDEAIFILSREKIGLIICDWYMPDKNGFELLKYVRASGALKKTPFIICTSSPTRNDVIQAYKVGVQCYLRKPVELSSLKVKLDDLVTLEMLPPPEKSPEELAKDLSYIKPLESLESVGFIRRNGEIVISLEGGAEIQSELKKIVPEVRFISIRSESDSAQLSEEIQQWKSLIVKEEESENNEDE